MGSQDFNDWIFNFACWQARNLGEATSGNVTRADKPETVGSDGALAQVSASPKLRWMGWRDDDE